LLLLKKNGFAVMVYNKQIMADAQTARAAYSKRYGNRNAHV
jgi:hypothetical protein